MIYNNKGLVSILLILQTIAGGLRALYTVPDSRIQANETVSSWALQVIITDR